MSDTDTRLTKEQLEQVAKEANWKQARVVYADEIEVLINDAVREELQQIHGDCKSLNGHAAYESNLIHKRLAELTQDAALSKDKEAL